MSKDTFLVYSDWVMLIEGLTDEQVGQIFKGIFAIQNGDSYYFKPEVENIAKYFLNKINKNVEKYEEICKKRSDVAKKREADRKNKNTQVNTNVHNCAQVNTSEGDTDTVTDTDTDTVTDTDTENITTKRSNNSFSSFVTDLTSEKKKVTTPPTLEEVRDFFFVTLVNEMEEIDFDEPDDFYNFNAANGWINHGHKIKDWTIFARNYHRERKRRRGEV